MVAVAACDWWVLAHKDGGWQKRGTSVEPSLTCVFDALATTRWRDKGRPVTSPTETASASLYFLIYVIAVQEVRNLRLVRNFVSFHIIRIFPPKYKAGLYVLNDYP